MPATEAAVVLLVVALYLQDSLLLLYDNEAVIEARGNGYRAHLGAAAFHLGGRNPFIPNPLAFWRPLFRTVWHAVPSPSEAVPLQVAPMESATRALRAARWGLIPIAVGLFAGLPTCLYFNAGWTPFLTLVAVMYLCAVGVLSLLWRKRAALGIDRRRFAKLCFESLICMPCILNVVRKSSLGVPMNGDLIEAAPRLLSAANCRSLVEQVVRRVDEKIEAEEENTSKWEALTQYRARLSRMVA